MALIITSIKPINLSYVALSVLILVLLLVSFVTVMFYVDYLISLTRLCFIVFLSLYILMDYDYLLIYLAARLQECLITLLTHLLSYSECMLLNPIRQLESLTEDLAAVERQRFFCTGRNLKLF